MTTDRRLDSQQLFQTSGNGARQSGAARRTSRAADLFAMRVEARRMLVVRRSRAAARLSPPRWATFSRFCIWQKGTHAGEAGRMYGQGGICP